MRLLLRLKFRRIINIPRRLILKRNNVAIGKHFGLSLGTELYFSDSAQVTIGSNVSSDGKCRIIASDHAVLSIGDDCYFNMNCLVGSNQYISIGRHCVFGPGVVITDNDHRFEKDKGISCHQYNNGSISIDEECWVGANAVILRDTHIGRGCVIGAGCVVKGDIPDNSIITCKQDLHIHQIEDR